MGAGVKGLFYLNLKINPKRPTLPDLIRDYIVTRFTFKALAAALTDS
jgi:hypothetical protein